MTLTPGSSLSEGEKMNKNKDVKKRVSAVVRIKAAMRKGWGVTGWVSERPH